MSTYNGEKYIREQIDSILKQTLVNVELYIRDDGSTDSTVQIISEYEQVHLIKGENIGVGNSFMELLYMVPHEFDYYAFSDQDDIWLENKLEKAVEKIKNQEEPALYCSNQILVNKYGKNKHERYITKPDLSVEMIFSQNNAVGCTMLWNDMLNEIIVSHKPSKHLLENRIHDCWVAMVAGICGIIIYDENGYILYRQHENNVIGVKKANLYDELMEKMKKLKRKELRNGRSKLAKEVVRLFPKESSKCKALCLAADSKSIMGKFKLIKSNRYFRKYSGESFIGFSLKVVLGLI
jgi:rhamnosyltransferase